MKYLLFLMVFCGVTNASAVQLFISAGKGFADKSEDGIWYQARFKHDFRGVGGFGAVGITDKVEIWGRPARWRLYGFYLGSFTNDAEAVQDENYAPRSPTGCIPAGCGLLARYQSELSVRGVAATIAPEFNLFEVAGKPLIFSIEGGLAVYQPKMDVQVYNLDGGSPASTHRSYEYKWGKNVGEVFGFGLEHGNIRLAFTRRKINLRAVDSHNPLTEVPANTSEFIDTLSVELRFWE